MGAFDHFPYTNVHELNLDWILAKIKEVLNAIDDLEEWKSQHEAEYEQLKQLYDDIMSGNFPDSIKTAFADWMNKNALDLVGNLVKQVYFGLTNDGYFIAYIPDSWYDIIFGTSGLDDFPPGIDYGHLTLTY